MDRERRIALPVLRIVHDASKVEASGREIASAKLAMAIGSFRREMRCNMSGIGCV
jgi:hypothetical protein